MPLLTTTSLLVPIVVAPARAAVRRDDAEYEITDWIIIAPSGHVTLGLSQPEVGQGSYTALPQILADELDADWRRVKVRFVTGRPAYKIAFRQEAPAQKEGASMSTTALYERLRIAGAAAREVLTLAAAQRWGIDVSKCRTEKCFVINTRGERLSYGALAPDAAKLPLSASPPLKDSGRFRLIGRPVARLDTPAKCDGRAVYGIDVVVPGMLNAAISMAPAFTGEVIAIKNEADILEMPGVRAVVKLPAVTVADEHGGSQHPNMLGLPRANAVCVVADYLLAGQARARFARCRLRPRQPRRPLDRQDQRRAGRRVDGGARRHRARARPSEGDPAGSRCIGRSSGASCCRTSRTRRMSR